MSPLASQRGYGPKAACRIITVDPATRRIEGALRDGAMVQIKAVEVSTVFRWPLEGEIWLIRQDDGYWILDSRMEQPEDGIGDITALRAGDTQITGNTQITGSASISGSTQISGGAQIAGDTQISGNASISGDLTVGSEQAAVSQYSSGTFINRPTYGSAGRYYYASDTARLYLDTGSSWVEVASGPQSVTQTTLAPGLYTPIGGIMQFAGSTAPTNWLLCNGDPVSRSTYADLFAAISTNYGTGNGSTTFNLPDLRGRVPVGKGSHVDVVSLGKSEGVTDESLRTPKHRHGLSTGRGGVFAAHENSGATGNSSFYTTPTVTSGHRIFVTGNSTATGGDTNNLNTSAYVVTNYIIRAL